jgi:DUF4097 and DUF4098 domain-containing protein YvlB
MNISRLLKPIFALGLIISSPLLAKDKVDRQADVASDVRVSIENLRGEVEILGWDKEQISVVGELDEKAEKLIFEQQGEKFVIEVVVPKSRKTFNDNDDGSNLVIHLPKSAYMQFSGVATDLVLKDLHNSSEVKTVSGDIKATNLHKRVDLNTVSGSINSQGLTGKVLLATVSGDIDDNGSAGRVTYQAVSGDLKINSEARDVSLSVVSGELEAELDLVDELSLNSVSGDMAVKLKLNDDARVKASSVSGEVKLYLPENVSADFSLRASAGGDIVNKLTNDKPIEAKYGPGAKLDFATAGAKASVKVATVSGDIKILR